MACKRCIEFICFMMLKGQSFLDYTIFFLLVNMKKIQNNTKIF